VSKNLFKTPYRVGRTEPVIFDGKVLDEGRITRENSGAVVIMAGKPGSDDYVRIGTVDMTVKPKRGEAWRTDDTEQIALAEFICRACNAHDDLLSALEGLVEHGTDSPAHLAAERAIVKARGQ